MIDVLPAVIGEYALFLLIPLTLIVIFQRFKLPELSAAVLGGVLISVLLGSAKLPVFKDFGWILLYIFFFCAGLNVQIEHHIQNSATLVKSLLLQLITLTGLTLILLVFGFSFLGALYAGIALSFASIGIIATTLYAKGEEVSMLGETIKTFLSWQQLCLLVLLIVFSHTHNLLQAAVSAGVLVGLYFLLFKNRWLPMDKIATHIWKYTPATRDLFLFLKVLVLIWLLARLEFAFLVSVYFAGIVCASMARKAALLPYAKKVERLVALLLCIFIGSQLDLTVVMQHPVYVLSLGLILFLAKWIFTLTALVMLGYSSRVTFALSTYLASLGESTFILLLANSQLLRVDEHIAILPILALALFLQPFLKEYQHTVYYYLRRFIRQYLGFLDLFLRRRIDSLRLPTEHISLKHHIVVCGYGRVGSQICRAMALANIPFVIVDQNYAVVLKAREEGSIAVYGEPTDREVLAFAKVDQAQAVVSTVSGLFNQEKLLLEAKKLNPKVIIMTCVYTKEDQQRLRDLGAEVVVQPKSEAALTLVKDIYYLKKLPRESMHDFITYFKLELGID